MRCDDMPQSWPLPSEGGYRRVGDARIIAGVAPHRLGIDIGGSSAKVSLLDAASRVLANTVHELPDVADDPVANRAARIGLVETTIHRVLDAHGSDLSVGIACPGIVDAAHRRVVALPGKLAGLEGIDWNESLRHRAALPRPLPLLRAAPRRRGVRGVRERLGHDRVGHRRPGLASRRRRVREAARSR
jgi:hypothetical protein